MVFLKMKKAICTLVALCVSVFCAFSCYGVRVCKLHKIEGKRTFYLHSSSSWAEQTEWLRLRDIPYIQGESVHFSFESDGEKREEFLRSVLKLYKAELVKIERASDTVSYYAYAPYLYKGLEIDGERVNLHIAFGEERVAVGTPILFGGF